MRGRDNQRQYPKKLKLLFDFLNLPGSPSLEEQGQIFLQKARAKENPYWAQDSIMSYLNYQKQRFYNREIAAGTLINHIVPIKMFCEMHDLANINWKRISRSLPPARKASKDRVPTIEEIRKIAEYPDRRTKPIVCVMCSSGIRVGAWDYLKWKHVIPIKNEKGDEIIVAKLIVYAGEPEEYYSFITSEAYQSVLDWMEFRASYGEKITPESWLMRNMWKTADVPRGAGGTNGLATYPKRLTSKGVAKILIRALLEQGIRTGLPPGVKRHSWKGAHGFRKFFGNTR